MDTQHCHDLLGRFAQARVLVVGDVYLDVSVLGELTEISLEAPVPVYEVHARSYNPGAAGNLACNLASLGATTCLVGVIGEDTNADILRGELAACGVDASGLVADSTRPTNTYGKLRAGTFQSTPQEILRTDTPRPDFIEGPIEEQVIANVSAKAADVDAIVVVDQVSAVVTERVIEAVTACRKQHKLITVGDSRKRLAVMKGFDVLVPNIREAALGVRVEEVSEASLHKVGKKLLKNARNVIVTRGSEGITAFAQDGSITDVPVTISRHQVVDVTGAGDTVTAAVTLALVSGGSPRDAAVIGNTAAGIAVGKVGAVAVSLEELKWMMGEKGGLAKVRTVDELETVVTQLQKEGKTVVWTNGCFDILHSGHITYLLEAAQTGDILIIGLNSDSSVKLNKGPTRPIIPEKERALVLSALECVDYVTIFSDETTVPLLERLKPDVYVKGGDYTVDTINQDERRLVEGYGGRIHIVSGIEGRSTTAIIDKIMQESRE